MFFKYTFFKLNLAARQLKLEHFPAIVMKTKIQNKFQTVLCYEGFINTSRLLGLVQSVLLACEAEIAQAAEISAMRSLQNEQNSAYMKSLEIDKEKLRKLSEQSNKTETAEEDDSTENIVESVDRTDVEDELRKRISKALLDFEDEPASGSEGNFRFQFLFPDGTRKIRTFSSKSTSKVNNLTSFFIFIL